MFKKRIIKKIYRPINLKIGTSGLISLKRQRFELVYLKFLKKILRRRHIKRRMFFRRRKF